MDSRRRLALAGSLDSAIFERLANGPPAVNELVGWCGEVESKVRFPLAHAPNGVKILMKLPAQH
jgi:hypothetical protein